jgi:hypothetical protein
MFTAAGDGNVDAYLACFTGPERKRLDQQLSDQSRDAFARGLIEAISTLKGRAVFLVGELQPNDSAAQVTVDRVYASRTERQKYRLIRNSRGWRIESVESAAAYQPVRPYGASVFDEP